jgi:predicted nuclease with TOPRIM domain
MTMFAYRFPLEFVFRIMDMIFAEGIESMFRIAIALLKKNKETLLTMDFEAVVEYLKNGLFDVYMHTPTINLIADAVNVKISKARLDKLQIEFEEMLKKETDVNTIGSDQLKTHNRHLQDQLKKLENAYELLNREHIELANTHVEKCNLVEKLQHRIEELEEQVAGLRSVVQDDRKRAEEAVKEEMDSVMQKNLVLTRRNVELSDSLGDMTLFLKAIANKVTDDQLVSDIRIRIADLSSFIQ